MRKPFTYSFAEFMDKLTIVSKKDLCGLPGARDELTTMMEWLHESDINGYLILSIIRITQSNMDIWNLEHELRNASEGTFPLHEAGRRAIMIREFNKTRIRYKNELEQMCGSDSVEEKIKHLSEEIYEKYYGK